jgi:CheY-like chemotaxis protein
MAELLLVEDDRTVLRSLARLFGRAGHEVVSAASCGTARAIRGHFELAVLDMDLPDGLGVDLAEELLSEGRTEAVVFFTASAPAELTPRFPRAPLNERISGFPPPGAWRERERLGAADAEAPCEGAWPAAFGPAPVEPAPVACNPAHCRDVTHVCPLRRAARLGPVLSKSAGGEALLELVSQMVPSAAEFQGHAHAS